MLSVFAIAVSRQASQELLFGQWLRDRVLSRNLAKSAIQRVLLELRADKFPVFDAFQESWSSNPAALKDVDLMTGKFSVVCRQDGLTLYGACDEAGKINVNKATPDMLKNLFMAADPLLGKNTAEEIADAVADWRDTDDNKTAHGAESQAYAALSKPYAPRNGPMQSVEELKLILGMTPELYEKIRPYVTVYTDGKINFNTAPKLTLMGLGLSDALADRVIEFRKGADQMPGTQDDEVFQEPAQISAAMSAKVAFSSEEFAQMANALAIGVASVKSEVFEVRALGTLNYQSRSTDTWITCVIKRDGTILSWKEGREA